MDYVVVDIGASGTRYTTIDNIVNFIPNNVKWLDDMKGKGGVGRNSDEVENNLDISIWKEGPKVEIGTGDKKTEVFPMRALIGAMADRQSGNERPGTGNKVKQRINYLSIIASVALSKLKNPSMGNDINLFSLLPPQEVQLFKETWVNNLKGNYTVAFNKLGPQVVTVQFKINDVFCFEESRMAIMQFLYDPRFPEREAQYSNKRILSIDIGASTTDLALFQDGIFLEKTGYTVKYGCNLARDYIIKNISPLVDEQLTFDEANQILIEGRVKNGAKYMDRDIIDPIIADSKRVVATMVREQLINYFNMIGINLSSIEYIIVSGGGSLPSSYVGDDGKVVITSDPMSTYITEALKDRCSGVEVVHFGDEPRTANVRGLGLFASVCDGVVAD